MNTNKVLFIDTETNGLFKDGERTKIEDAPYILSVAWASLDSDDTQVRYCRYGNDVEIPQATIDINGITREVMNEKGIDPAAVALELLDAIKNHDIIVCHNISYDINVICAHLRRYLPTWMFIEEFSYMMYTKPLICTQRAAAHQFKRGINEDGYYKRCGLQYSADQIGYKLENWHDAVADVEACKALYIDQLVNGYLKNPSKDFNKPEFSINYPNMFTTLNVRVGTGLYNKESLLCDIVVGGFEFTFDCEDEVAMWELFAWLQLCLKIVVPDKSVYDILCKQFAKFKMYPPFLYNANLLYGGSDDKMGHSTFYKYGWMLSEDHSQERLTHPIAFLS